MDPSSPPVDPELELRELRMRAYGPHADIQSDPVALARLSELEAARLPVPAAAAEPVIDAATPVDGGPPSAAPPGSSGYGDRPEVVTYAAEARNDAEPPSHWQTLTSSWGGRILLMIIAVAAILATASTLAWFLEPHPEATLEHTTVPADSVVFDMLGFLGAEMDVSTLQSFDPYRSVEPWYFEDDQGFHCMMLIIRPSAVEGANCVPPGVELFADLSPWPLIRGRDAEPLPDGSILRFHYRGDRVEMFVYPSTAE